MNKKLPMFALLIMITLTLLVTLLNVSPTYARTIRVRGKRNLEIELLPSERLFHPDEDGYFYPGSARITKDLRVVNVGDIPFRISRFDVILYEDKQLASGLMIEIEELGEGKGEEPRYLYIGTLSDLQNGIEISGKRAIPQGRSVILRIAVWMPETAGNEYQGLCMTADIAVTVYFPPRS